MYVYVYVLSGRERNGINPSDLQSDADVAAAATVAVDAVNKLLLRASRIRYIVQGVFTRKNVVPLIVHYNETTVITECRHGERKLFVFIERYRYVVRIFRKIRVLLKTDQLVSVVSINGRLFKRSFRCVWV